MTPTTQAIRLQMQQQARIKTLSDSELDIEIARAERRADAFDTAETKQWFAEMAARDANYCWLMVLRDERTDRARARTDQKFITDGRRVLGERLCNQEDASAP
jgi:hypothetical protein